MAVLIDTNVLLAGAFNRDQNHNKAVQILRVLRNEKCVVIPPVLSELFYMATVRINYNRAVEVFNLTKAAFQLSRCLLKICPGCRQS